MKKRFLSLTVFVFLVMLLICLTLGGCDKDTQVGSCRIVTPPTRTEYPVGYDGEIDMSGAVVVGVDRSGRDHTNSNFKYMPYAEYSLSDDITNTVYLDISDVDFSVPGTYQVHLHFLGNEQISDSFSIDIVG